MLRSLGRRLLVRLVVLGGCGGGILCFGLLPHSIVEARALQTLHELPIPLDHVVQLSAASNLLVCQHFDVLRLRIGLLNY